MSRKPTADGAVIAAHIAATTAAFQTLVFCLEENGSLRHGQMIEALRVYMETVKHRGGNELELAMLHDLRESLIE